ncbi:MAG: PucR family transcriptional regulator [Solirubrobacterales bacterium]
MAGKQRERSVSGQEASLDALSDAIESGEGLPEVARVAARVLGASIALIDRSSAVLAVAAGSSAEEAKLLGADDSVGSLPLRVADAAVGELRYRARSEEEADVTTLRLVATLLALEVERARSPEWASDEAAGDFVRSVLERKATDRGDIVARGSELGADLSGSSAVLVVRVHARRAQTGDWRARVLMLALRAVRSLCPGTLAADAGADHAEIDLVAPVTDAAHVERAATSLLRELTSGLEGMAVMVAHSDPVADPVDLYRAGNEARLAANVAEAQGESMLAFADTGAYRLLLPAMSDDPSVLQRFYSETIEPLAAYDDQYETDLVPTVEAYLDNDGNVAATSGQMYTHRHTIRYRLERIRELCGHDLTSTDGREKLGLGLKSMRVLGITRRRGPATEPGSEGGQVSYGAGSGELGG